MIKTGVKVLSKLKKVFARRIVKLLALIVAAGIIVAVLINFDVIKLNSSASAEVEHRIAVARRGDVELTLTGSGPAYSSNREDISSLVTGTVSKVYFKEGDEVKKGDLLFELDNSDALLNYEKTQNSITQNELALNNSTSDLSKLVITAPFNGQVINLSAKKGDVVNRNAAVLTLTDKSRMILALTFDGENKEDININQSTTVYLQNLKQSLEGRIVSVTSESAGGYEIGVEIELINPGLLEEGMMANASIHTINGEIWSNGNGVLSYANSQVIRSETGGKIREINVRENQFVNSGSILVVLEDDSLEITVKNNELKVQELRTQLDHQKRQLENFKIYAPIDGVIISQRFREGDSVRAGDVMSTVINNNSMELIVSIDELDIAKIKEGMEARVTVDALSYTMQNPLSGMVTNIALEGASSGGVTTYPVTVTVKNPGEMRSGMNSNAQIIISNVKDVIYVPIEAVQTIGGNSFVMVRGEGENTNIPRAQGERGDNRQTGQRRTIDRENMSREMSERFGDEDRSRAAMEEMTRRMGDVDLSAMMQGRANFGGINSEYYKNAVQKPVEIGINNEMYIEIVSGLSVGEQVILPPIVGTSNENRVSTGGMFPIGGMGGMDRSRIPSGLGGATGGRNR